MSSTRAWNTIRTKYKQCVLHCSRTQHHPRPRCFTANQFLTNAQSASRQSRRVNGFVAVYGAVVGFMTYRAFELKVSALHLRHVDECDDLADLSTRFRRSSNWKVQNMGVVINALLCQYQDGHEGAKFKGSCGKFLDSICEYLLTPNEKRGHTLKHNIAALSEKGYPTRLTDQMNRVQELAKKGNGREEQQEIVQHIRSIVGWLYVYVVVL